MPVAHDAIEVGELYVRDSEPDAEVFVVANVGAFHTKDSNASNWHPAVVYRSADDPNSEAYIRTVTDFGEKFSEFVDDLAEEETDDNGSATSDDVSTGHTDQEGGD